MKANLQVSQMKRCTGTFRIQSEGRFIAGVRAKRIISNNTSPNRYQQAE